MIPLRIATPLQTTPIVTRALLALNVVIFLAQLLSRRYGEVLIHVFGFIPARFLHPADFGVSWLETVPTLATSLVLHGGFVHLAGNLLYLWIFGGAVESRLGHGRLLALYLLSGMAGSLAHMAIYPQSEIPSIGASGCISGLLGAFLVLEPRSRIVTLIPFIVSWTIIEIPALVMLPLWFAVQFLNGFLTLASARGTQEAAAVAWWAHVGGFIVGSISALVVKKREAQMTS